MSDKQKLSGSTNEKLIANFSMGCHITSRNHTLQEPISSILPSHYESRLGVQLKKLLFLFIHLFNLSTMSQLLHAQTMPY